MPQFEESILERQLLPERQERFLFQAFGRDAERLPTQDYDTAFLLLPYVMLEKIQEGSNTYGHLLVKNFNRLYRGLSGESDVDIALDEYVLPNTIVVNRHLVAKSVARFINVDEIVAVVDSIS